MPSSKRPSAINRNGKKAIKLVGRYNENTLFSNILRDCGVLLSDGSRANSMIVEQSRFLKKFNDAIVSHEDYPTVISDISEGVEKYMENGERFLRMMLTTDLIENMDHDEDLPTAPQDSIVRLMLKTQPLQTKLAKSLIERMRDYAADPMCSLENSTDNPINILHLILNQLRWLDSMEDANAIALKLIDTATQLKGQIACSIITSLPEIVGDEVKDNVIDRLKGFLGDNHDMTIPLLSTVGSLNCSPAAFLNFERTVFSLLASQNLNEYPFIIKFLLQTLNDSNAEDNIARMRPHISFSLSSYSQDSISDNETVNAASLKLLAETILHAAQYRTMVADAWIEILKKLNSQSFTCADFVTVILFSATYNAYLQKNALALLKAKVTEDVINDQLVRSTFTDCTTVLNQYFSSILNLATQFLSSNATSSRHFGGCLYVCMFTYLKSSLRKDVIKSLVQHVSSFTASEVDTALNSLLRIVSNSLDLILPHADSVDEVMDHMERLTSSQMRLIFEIMTRMSIAGGANQSSQLEETLSGVIRKYSTHSLTKFKCIGIIGAVSTLNVMGKKEICSEKYFKNIKSTLNFLHEIIGSDNRIGSYYFDELCNVSFDLISPRLRKKLYAVIQKIISEKFVIEHSAEENMSLKSAFGSQKSSESTISIYQSVQASDSSYLLLCPVFKALFKVATESQEEEVYNLTQLPIQLHCSVFEAKEFKLQSKIEQKFALDALFVAINLFRENVNILCYQKDSFHHLLSRINSIIEMENIIETLLSKLSQKYNPPLMLAEFANFYQPDETSVIKVTQTQGSHTTQLQSPKKGGSPMKKSKVGKRKNDAGFTFQSLKPQHFRELSSKITSVLEIPMAEDLFEQDINVANSSDDVTLTAGQALFILRDLKRKIVHKLPARVAEKRSPFANTSQCGFEELDRVVEDDFGHSACNVMPNLCNHLECVNGIYDDNRQEHFDVKNRSLLISLYENILEVILHIVSWRGLKSNTSLLKNVLFNIVKRFSPGLSKDSNIRNLAKGCVDYLQQFEKTIRECSLQAAFFMMKLLHAISGFDDIEGNSELRTKLHAYSTNMLKNDWDSFTDQTCPAAKKNDHLLFLLKTNLQTSVDVMKRAAHFVDEGLCKLGHDDAMYPNFVKSNSHILYCGLLEVMTDETCKIPAIKIGDEESTSIEILLKWNDCIKVTGVIVKLLREYHSRQNVLSSLKHGKIIIENFTKNGMPICEKLFDVHQDDIVSTLKHLQTTTRQLQHLTCHSKVTQDTVLAKQVPPLKKCLESLPFRVKAMLAYNNCQEAFWMGNLKNRNLQGEEIMSQLTQQQGNTQDANTTCEYQEMSYSESY